MDACATGTFATAYNNVRYSTFVNEIFVKNLEKFSSGGPAARLLRHLQFPNTVLTSNPATVIFAGITRAIAGPNFDHEKQRARS
jgi:hypothetical protein